MEKNSNEILHVIIPTFNRLKYLKQAIQSIEDQDSDLYRLTVVDSASDDGTEEYLADKAGVEYVRFENNLGVYGNWTRAIGMAESSLFVMFHDDDLMLPDFVSSVMSYFLENDDVSFVHSAAYLVDSEGAIFSERKISHLSNKFTGSEFVERVINGSGHNPIPPSVCINKRLVPEHELYFNEKLNFVSDLECFIRLSSYGKVGYIDKPIMSYRVHFGSATSAFLRNFELKTNDRFVFKQMLLGAEFEFVKTLRLDRFTARALVRDLMLLREQRVCIKEGVRLRRRYCQETAIWRWRVYFTVLSVVVSLFPVYLLKRIQLRSWRK